MDALSTHELLTLLRIARARRERDFLIILLATRHGLRISEVLAIKASDIHEGNLTVKRLKGSKKTTQPLLEHEDPLLNEKAAVFEFIRNLRPNQKLFAIKRRRFDQIMKQYGELAKIEPSKRHAHCLKHTTGRQLVKKIVINELQQWLGHKSLASTGVYTEVDDAEASAAVKRVNPLD